MAYLSIAVDIQVISTWNSLVYRVPTTFFCRINAAEIPRLGERHDHKWKYTITIINGNIRLINVKSEMRMIFC